MNTCYIEKVHYAGQSEEYQDFDEFIICSKCGGEIESRPCEECAEGFSYHDCGEDTCCCIDPQPNVVCDYCNGEGQLYWCERCRSFKELKHE